jgi:hypothetical protein
LLDVVVVLVLQDSLVDPARSVLSTASWVSPLVARSMASSVDSVSPMVWPKRLAEAPLVLVVAEGARLSRLMTRLTDPAREVGDAPAR